MSVLQSKRRAVINEPHKATQSGAVVQMDKAEYAPMGVVANFAPVQDLHGQTSPYPAGGGKNLLPQDLEYMTTQTASFSNAIYLDVGNYTINFESSTATSWRYYIVVYDSNGTRLTTGTQLTSTNIEWRANQYGWLQGSNVTQKSLKFTIEEAAYFAFGLKDGNVTASDTFYHSQLEKGSSATDYAPYSNICPITGWTGCNVYDDPRYGGLINWNQLIEPKNNGSFSVYDVTITITDGKYSMSGTATGSGGRNTAWNKTEFTLANGHLYICNIPTGMICSSTSGTYLFGRQAGFSFINWSTNETTTAHLGVNVLSGTTYSDEGYIELFDLSQDFGETIANEIYAMEQAEAGAGVAYFKSLFYKSYYPYNAGQQMTVGQVNGEPYRAVEVDWTDEAGTVYGGTFDLANGVLTATHKIIEYDGSSDESWAVYSSPRFYIACSDFTAPAVNVVADIKTNRLQVISKQGMGSTNYRFSASDASSHQFMIRINANVNTVALLRSWLSENPLQVCYKLTTPITYTLTPTQIKSLRGKNNVWTDTNGNTSATIYVH